MKNYLCLCLASLMSFSAHATDIDTTLAIKQEATMRGLITNVLTNQDFKSRDESSVELEKVMEKTLKEAGSYDYNFANLQGVSVIQPADKAGLCNFSVLLQIFYGDAGSSLP